MQTWQIILLGYFGILLAWTIINAILLLSSFIIKKKVFLVSEFITQILGIIFSLVTGVGDIAFIIWLFQNKQFIWGIICIFLGVSLVSGIGHILALPFVFVVSLFSVWYDEKN